MALTPLYFQVEKKLREKISESEMVNEKGALPNEGELCKIFGVSRITIRKALSELAVDGLIIRKAGKGTFVLPKKKRTFSMRLTGNFGELVTHGIQSRMKMLRTKLIDASPEIQKKLSLGDGEKIFHYEGLRQLGKEFYSFFNVYVPHHIGKLFTPSNLKKKNTIFNLIEETMGTRIIEADQVITASVVSNKVANHLRMKKGYPILLVERVYFAQDRKPVELAISYFRPDLYQYKIKLIRRNF